MYLITGASGHVGREIIARLVQAGERVRAYVRDPAKLQAWRARIDIVAGDYDTPDIFARALDGVDGVFMMNIGNAAAFRRLISEAAAKGTPRAVFLSTSIIDLLPDNALARMHREKEDIIREAGLTGRFLRPVGFMSNTYLWAESIKAQGVVHNAFGTARFAPIAPEDIASVAVRALTDAALDREVLTLTGSEMISVPEQVAALAAALDKPLRCVDISLETARQNLVQNGIPEVIAASVVQAYQAVREGLNVAQTDTVEQVTGRSPMRFGEWVRGHVGQFA